jgi:hypothetical protein
MAQFNFDPSSVPKSERNFEVLPAGKYAAQVVESEVVDLKSGNGSALKLTIEILQEGYRGRKVWANLNVKHNNPVAEKIAQEQLRELCDSIGVVRMQDTVELHNKPFEVKLKIRKGEGSYDDQNDVAGFKPLGGSPAHAQAMTAAPRTAAPGAAATPAAGGTTPPWNRSKAA